MLGQAKCATGPVPTIARGSRHGSRGYRGLRCHRADDAACRDPDCRSASADSTAAAASAPRPDRSCAAHRGTLRNRKRSRSRRHARAAATATRRRRPHTAFAARCRNPPAGTRSACCRPCPSAAASASTRSLGCFRRTGRAVQLMKGQHFGLDGHARRLVAQKLRDQRQIERLARAGRAGGDHRHQFLLQRAQIDPAERHRRELGKSDAVRAGTRGKIGAGGTLTLQDRPPSTSSRSLESIQLCRFGLVSSVVPNLRQKRGSCLNRSRISRRATDIWSGIVERALRWPGKTPASCSEPPAVHSPPDRGRLARSRRSCSASWSGSGSAGPSRPVFGSARWRSRSEYRQCSADRPAASGWSQCSALRALTCAAELVPVGDAVKAANTAMFCNCVRMACSLAWAPKSTVSDESMRATDEVTRRTRPRIAGVPGHRVGRAADQRRRRRAGTPTRSGG